MKTYLLKPMVVVCLCLLTASFMLDFDMIKRYFLIIIKW